MDTSSKASILPPTTDRWTDTVLEPFRLMGDRPADPVIQRTFANNELEAINRMLRSIERNEHIIPAEMPDSMEQFLNQTDDWPAWAEPGKIRLGQKLFARYGMEMLLSLLAWSLPCCYSWAKGARVLTWTGRMDKYVHHRLIETAQFLLDVMAEGGLEPGGHGVRTAQKIRLLHTTIRYHLLQDPKWRTEEWGIPINQEDLAGTLLSFALLPRTLTKLGLDFTPEEEDAFLHCWKVVGHIMGVEHELLPRDMDDAQRLWDAIMRRNLGPSEAGRALTRALLDYMKQSVPGTMFDGIAPMLTRQLCGDAVADAVGVEKADWTRHLMGPMRLFLNLTDEAQDRSAIVAKLVGTVSRKLMEAIHSVERGGNRVAFRIPQSLQDSWGLKP
ncbi:MAG TPA: oxygenase MpaB family protein [Archangium sp.]|nr:oxygenase MpaB family protein [Archangium sp.]